MLVNGGICVHVLRIHTRTHTYPYGCRKVFQKDSRTPNQKGGSRSGPSHLWLLLFSSSPEPPLSSSVNPHLSRTPPAAIFKIPTPPALSIPFCCFIFLSNTYCQLPHFMVYLFVCVIFASLPRLSSSWGEGFFLSVLLCVPSAWGSVCS